MPAQESHVHFRPHKAVYWAVSATDGYGEQTYESPVEIQVRWDDRQQKMMDAKGNTITVDGTVQSSQDLDVDGLLWKGALADLPTTDQITGLRQIKMFNNIPDIKGRKSFRMAGFMRYRDGDATVLNPTGVNAFEFIGGGQLTFLDGTQASFLS